MAISILNPLNWLMAAKPPKNFKHFLNNPEHLQTLAFVASAFLAGLVAVGYAGLFKIFEGYYHQIAADHPYWIWFWTPLCLLAGWAMVYFFAPEAAGSGIPQVLAANDLNYRKNSAWVDRLLSLKMVAVKIISSLLVCLGGAVTGREGPTIQISAGIFHFVGKFTRKILPQIDPQTWIVAGAAAGLAAAFNTPLGGIMFAIEEMSISFKRFRTALIVSIIIAGLVSQWILGTYLYLGYPSIGDISFSILPEALLIGVLTGLAGSLYGFCIKRLLDWRSRFKTAPVLALLALVCGFALASMAFLNSDASGSGSAVMNALLFKGQKAGWDLPLLRIAGSLVFYVSGAAGGIFAPALAAGACLSSFVTSWLSLGSPELLVLLGMAGFLTGVTRTPFTAFVLILEMTDHHNAIFPIMLCAITAEFSAKLLDKESFYEWSRTRFMPASSHPNTKKRFDRS
jgi:H+/Cl- antiporter ClcA